MIIVKEKLNLGCTFDLNSVKFCKKYVDFLQNCIIRVKLERSFGGACAKTKKPIILSTEWLLMKK